MEEKKEFKPFIPADKVLPEFTVTSIILGIILAVVFAVANLDKVLDLSSIYGDNFMAVGNWVGILAFILLLSIMIRFCKNKKTVKKDI